MTDNGEHQALDVERHEWWDRRMSVRNNLRFGFWLPLLCLLTAHEWTEWFEYGNGTESSWCNRCMREAVRPTTALPGR